jgi:zinc transporter, ZIP family
LYEYSVLAAASSNVSTLDILRTILLTGFAGFTSFLGIYLSKRINFSERHILALTSFGAGILISVAIFGMVVEAEKIVGLTITVFAFVIGAILFTVLDRIAEKKGGGAGILLGIGLDSIPESLAIGAAVGFSGPFAAIALLIGIQNIPEGIASYREMKEGKSILKNTRNAFIATGIISAIPVVMGLIGLFFMRGMEQIIGMILALSAGGIFYMLYYDMIPKAHKEKEWLTTFGAVLGFIIGFVVVLTIGS